MSHEHGGSAAAMEASPGRSGRVPDPAPAWPDATIVFLIKDPGDRELQTLALIKAQIYPGRVLIHVIDSSPDIAGYANQVMKESADGWEAIPTETFNHGDTRQRGVDVATTPVVVYLSSDAHPADDRWLEKLVAPLAEGRAEASYGRQRSPVVNAEREKTFDFLYPETPVIKSKETIATLGIRAFHMSDVTAAYLTDVIRKVRFPSDIPLSEDVAVAMRLIDQGYRIAYVPDAVVFHVHEMDLRGIWRRYKQIGYIYEHIGVFDQVAAQKGGRLGREGLSAVRALSSGRRGIRATLRGGGVAVLKAIAVARGRSIARRQDRKGWGSADSGKNGSAAPR